MANTLNSKAILTRITPELHKYLTDAAWQARVSREEYVRVLLEIDMRNDRMRRNRAATTSRPATPAQAASAAKGGRKV